MMTFYLEEKEKISLKSFDSMSLLEKMGDERHFTVYVNNHVFIDDICLLVKEFISYALDWLKNRSTDFVFNSIDDDENPLIAFYKLKQGWKLVSVWQKFMCDDFFSDDEVIHFVNDIISQTTF